MKWGFITICSIVSIINLIYPLNFGYTAESDLYTHISFVFVHANVLHLLINMFVFHQSYEVVKRKFKYPLITAIGISFLSSLVCIKGVPTVGASGVVFALIGMFYGLYKLERKYYIKNFSFIAIATVVGYYTNVNIELHILCLVFGLLHVFIFHRFLSSPKDSL